MEKYLESLEGHVAQFKNAVQELIFDLQASGFLKDLVDFGTKLINILDKMVEYIGPGGTLLTIFSLWTGVTKGDKILSFGKGILNTFAQLNATGVTQALDKVDDGIESVGESSTKGAKEVSLLVQAFNGLKSVLGTGGMIGLGGAITALTGIILVAKTASEAIDELRESSTEYASNYYSSKEDIEGYKEEISSLQSILNDSNSSYEQSREAREKLLTIQNDLIDKYGKERESINDITTAISGEVDALDRLTKKQWERQKESFNNKDLKGVDAFARAFGNASTNLELMLNQIEGKGRNGIEVNLLANTSLKANTDFYRNIASKYGLKFGVNEELNSGNLQLKGNAYDVLEVLEKIQKEAEDAGETIDKSVLKSIQKEIKSLSEITEEWEDFYKLYTLQEHIFGNEKYEGKYANYLSAITDLKNATSEEEEREAKKNVVELYKDIFTSVQEDEELEDGIKGAV